MLKLIHFLIKYIFCALVISNSLLNLIATKKNTLERRSSPCDIVAQNMQANHGHIIKAKIIEANAAMIQLLPPQPKKKKSLSSLQSHPLKLDSLSDIAQ